MVDMNLADKYKSNKDIEPKIFEPTEVGQMKTYEEWSQAWDMLESTTNWKKGEILSSVSTSYGDSSLKKFAESKGLNYSTALGLVQTFRAYGKIPQGIIWTVARELAAQPDREEILTNSPGMTVSEARALVKERKQKSLPQEPEPVKPTPSGKPPEGQSEALWPTEILPPEEDSFEGKTSQELHDELVELLESRARAETVPYDITPDKAIKMAVDFSSGWLEMATRIVQNDLSSNMKAKVRIELQILKDMIDLIEDKL